jgi:uncharacterized protein (DUF427 family)
LANKEKYIVASATGNGEVIAESENCITTEGNLYFPPESVKFEFLMPSKTRYMCPWKGEAGYYDLEARGKVLKDAAKPLTNHIAFDKNLGVKIEGAAAAKIESPVRVH